MSVLNCAWNSGCKTFYKEYFHSWRSASLIISSFFLQILSCWTGMCYLHTMWAITWSIDKVLLLNEVIALERFTAWLWKLFQRKGPILIQLWIKWKLLLSQASHQHTGSAPGLHAHPFDFWHLKIYSSGLFTASVMRQKMNNMCVHVCVREKERKKERNIEGGSLLEGRIYKIDFESKHQAIWAI